MRVSRHPSVTDIRSNNRYLQIVRASSACLVGSRKGWNTGTVGLSKGRGEPLCLWGGRTRFTRYWQLPDAVRTNGVVAEVSQLPYWTFTGTCGHHVTTYDKMLQHMTKYMECLPFCENPVCPDPIWKPVKVRIRKSGGSDRAESYFEQANFPHYRRKPSNFSTWGFSYHVNQANWGFKRVALPIWEAGRWLFKIRLLIWAHRQNLNIPSIHCTTHNISDSVPLRWVPSSGLWP